MPDFLANSMRSFGQTLKHVFTCNVSSPSKKAEEFFARQSSLANDRSDRAARQVAIVVWDGGVSSRVFVEELEVTA